MSSKIEIINQALSSLGEPPIETISEDTKQARAAVLIYDDKRDALMQEHLWNFAISRASLPVSMTTPEWGFDNAYQIPSDSLRIVSVEFQDDDSWEVEGQTIVTDAEGPLNVKYISRVEDENQMTAQFRETLAALLAKELAEILVKTSTVKADLQQEYSDKLRIARSMDGAEADAYIRPIGPDSWINGRITGAPGPPGNRFN